MVITVSAISGVVDSLPKKLQQLEQEQSFALSYTDHQSIGRLKDELELIRGAFEQYSTLESPTEFTRQWVQKVREVAYDIEEFIDRYTNGVGNAKSNKQVSSGGTLSRLTGYVRARMNWGRARRRSISDELKLQQERLHVQILEKPGIMTSSTLRPGEYSRPTTTTAELQLASSPLLVGMEESMEQLSKMVMDDDRPTAVDVKVISIVGMAGAGKTTLARQVYRHLGERYGFYCRAFVSVGRRRADDLYMVLKDVIFNLAGGDNGGQDAVDDTDELKLKAIIAERLQHKRYFIVLDDLWSNEDWGEIRSCFPNNNLGSRIVTTTRIEAVAKACCSSPIDSVFKIPLLNESDSETLFFARTFGSKNDCPSNLMDVSMHILRKCRGLPLAIVNIADGLIDKPSEWEKYELDMQSKLYINGMKEVFDPSYNDIPPHLKTCLLYLTIFPENYEIRRQRLIRRWIAEGFIDEQRGINKEQVATDYFNGLINRNLVQPGQVDYDGNARSCRVHPVMHDFLVCKSMEENFVTLVHPGGLQDHTPYNGAIRWLSVHGKAKENQGREHNESADLSHTRSLSLFGDVSPMPQLKKMEMLRVLDLEDCQSSLDRSLDVLPMLFLLRYLSLRGTDASRLPSAIGALHHLETIDIRRTRIQVLPPSIVQLHKLVYLLAGMISLPRGVGKLKALQTLSYADIKKSDMSAVQELGDLTNLVKLAIFCSQESRNSLLPVLQKLAGHSLRSLVVAGRSGCWMDSSHSLPTPPRFSLQRFQIDDSVLNTIPKVVASSSVNLVEMDISFQQLSAQGLRVLESIQSLLRLCLCLMFVQEEQFVFQNDGFPNLKELCFRCRDLPSITFTSGALPMLKQLELNFQECSSSEEPIVSGIEYLTSLMHAVVAFPREDVGTKVVSDVRKAALVHPNNPDVFVKTGKELSSVSSSSDFEELDRVPHKNVKSTVSIEPDNNSRSLFVNLTVHMVSYSVVNQSGDVFGLFSVLLLFIYLQMLLSDRGRFKGQHIYLDTGVSLVIAYALLLGINLQYCILVPFPICLVLFIAYLRNEILVKGKLQKDRKMTEETEKIGGHSRSMDDVGKDRKKIEEHVIAAAIPYCMLSASVLYGDGSPVLSHFLIFSCCALGTLALMYSRLADEVSPALKPAQEYVQMAYMVMLFITIHTVAAEHLGEVTALVCMPELIAGLVWFSTLLQSGHSNRAVDQVTSYKYGFIFIPLGAVLAGLTSIYGYGYEGGLTEGTVACGAAGCMPYLSVWMISRWPGSIPASDTATQLLKFLANICLTGACLMLLAVLAEKTPAYRLFGVGDPSVKYLVPFAICLIAFIAYLPNEIWVKGKLQKDRKISKETKKTGGISRSLDDMGKDTLKIIEEHATATVIPSCMLSALILYGHGSSLLSYFLGLSCCVLGLALIVFTFAIEYPALAPGYFSKQKLVQEYIKMAYLVMLFITVHTVAAEYLGEVTALICMPELIAGLLWFSTLLRSGHSNKAVDEATSYKYGFISIPLGAILAAGLTSTYGYEATVACGVAGCMPYISVWMISWWPRRIPASDTATQLLKFLANICLTGACLMLLIVLAEKALAYRLFGLGDPSVLKYLICFTIAVALLLPLFVKHLAGALRINYVMELPAGFAAE
ncbi:unnamed protein product [Urochloa humidicola]